MSDDVARPSGGARNEVRGAAGVVSEAVDILSRPVQGTHQTVADGVFGALRRTGLGPATDPIRRLHDGITTGIYASIRGIGHLAGQGVGAVATLARGDEWRPITSRRRGAVVTGAINGFVGDHLAALGNDLTVPMTLYTASLTAGQVPLPLQAGRDTERSGESAGAGPGATALRAAVDDHPERHLDHVVVFLHGLGETEHWWRKADEASAGEGYAERIASTVGAVPLLLRYNSGLPVAENGAALSVLLSEVAERWPVPIRRLDLVGHSMGGLVLRHACHAAVRDGAPTGASAATGRSPWVASVARMVYLGTPHRGAPLAHRVDQLATRLSRWSRSRTWGEFLDRRSAGIRDLVAGVSDEEVPLLATASHHGVAACVTASEHHRLANLLGDLLVPVDSARGAIADVEPLPSSHHFHLLNDPEVHEHLLRWLATDEPVDPPADSAR